MPKKIRVLIIEDDQDTVEYLKDILTKEIDYVDVIGYSDSVANSTEIINRSKPEIILMDIMLSDGNSFSILDAFPKPNFEVIFISAYSEYMKKALEYYAFSFITKPIEHERLIELFQKYSNLKQRMFSNYKYEMLKEMILENGQKFLLHVGNEHITVNFSEIIHCKADGNYTTFYLSDKRSFLVYKPLGYYSDLLEAKGFLRIGRFDLININNVISIYKKETVILSNGEKVSISKRNKSKLQMLIEKLSL